MGNIYTDKDDIKKSSTALFGQRFYSDQGSLELLSELLLVCFSNKRIDDIEKTDLIPQYTDLSSINNFEYQPIYRLKLKLFALFNNRSGDLEVPALSNEYKEIRTSLKNKIEDAPESADRYIDIIRELYKGFQAVGNNRDWCAQSFLPICKEMIAGESIWKNTDAKKCTSKQLDNIDDVKKLFAHDKHDFYARGGEVLYLQLFSALNHSKEDVQNWLADKDNPFYGITLRSKEKDPEYLRTSLNKLIASFYEKSVPEFFSSFINDEFEDGFLERDKDSFMQLKCIPEGTWYYGYIFAVELVRLMRSSLDIIDMLKMLELECSMHLIRTLLGRSSECLELPYPLIPVVSPDCDNMTYKIISSDLFKYCQCIIRSALIKKGKELNDDVQNRDHTYYGYKLFQKVAKAINFVIPPKGPDAHFIITKELIVLLVSTTLIPGKELITYDEFLADIKTRFGIVVDSDGFTNANKQLKKSQRISDSEIDKWFIRMLDECNYYVNLSDSLSLVKNTNVMVGGDDE